MIISLLQEKGGSGKTTIAINVARAVKDFGHSVLLVDSDPQGSARDWHTMNNGGVLDTIGFDRPTIDKDIQRFKNEYEYIFVDGSSHISTMTIKTIICSDVVLIPVQPSPYDIWASKSLVDLIKQRQEVTEGKPKAAFIISRQITQTNLGKEVRGILKDYGLHVLDRGTFQRVTYPTTAAKGVTVLSPKYEPAASEVRLLAQEIMEFCNVIA